MQCSITRSADKRNMKLFLHGRGLAKFFVLEARALHAPYFGKARWAIHSPHLGASFDFGGTRPVAELAAERGGGLWVLREEAASGELSFNSRPTVAISYNEKSRRRDEGAGSIKEVAVHVARTERGERDLVEHAKMVRGARDINPQIFRNDPGASHFHDLLGVRPFWDPASQQYMLNFFGRARAASIKNIQLASALPELWPNVILYQVGKVETNESGETEFIMDASAPLSLVQAFGVAVSDIDWKWVT